jgi:methylase of polypeptide subunit release factors
LVPGNQRTDDIVAGVDLRTELRDIRALEDLPRLIAALGHEPLWDRLPAVRGQRLERGPSPVVVGRSGGLPWLAVEAANPEKAARALARRMVVRGRLAATLAIDPRSGRIAVAVALEGVPSLAVTAPDPDPVALRCLARLAGGGEGALVYALRAAEALRGETAGRRFFREFRNTLDRMAARLPGPARSDDRRAFALLQLTRVLFLYFVQAKGWLAGRDRFLFEEVERCLSHGRRIHRDLLRPLFFGTLNRPPGERSRTASGFGAVPFLNGGLFEPHPLDRRLRRDVPNDVWRDAFDGLFERFHFTVAEGVEDGRIAPDMLGRVFEGVMARDARRASGTYYTPASLVGNLLEAGLTAIVAHRTGKREVQARRMLAERAPEAWAAVENVALLDPAVGSGAFLLGALERLAALSPEGDSSGSRRAILQRNLFGVDRSAGAVRLTELRLWLAVIARDPAEQADRVLPLPNLDCLIRQGDSLFDPVGAGLRLPPAAAGMAGELARARPLVVAASGPEKRAALRRLAELEAALARAALENAEQAGAAAVAECLREARSGDLFGTRRGLDRGLRSRLAALRRELHVVRRARRALARDGELSWFSYQCHFADVFARGGFDLVIGNPPWLRAEELPEEQRRRLSGRYRWWISGGRGYANRPDLAVAFLERAVELAAPDGVVALLVPAKLATAGYGSAARHALAATTTLLHVADLSGRPEAAFEATVYPLAVVARKSRPDPRHRVGSELTGATGAAVPQTRLLGGGPWILVREPLREALAGLAREHPTLDGILACHLGLKTGANHIFLDPPEELEPDLVRHAVRGRDLRPFAAEPRRRLLFTHSADGRPLRSLPPGAAAYLAAHADELRGRADYAGGPPWSLFRVAAATAPHRVVWPDLARRLTAAALVGRRDARLVPLNTCYVAPTRSAVEAERVTAWLNASWLRAAARAGAVPAAGGFARFTAGVVGRLPLPSHVLACTALPELAAAGRRGEPIQDDLDELTARHLELSAGARSALRRFLAGSTGDRG